MTTQPKPCVQSIMFAPEKQDYWICIPFEQKVSQAVEKKIQFRATFKEKHIIPVISKCY